MLREISSAPKRLSFNAKWIIEDGPGWEDIVRAYEDTLDN